MAIGQRIKFFRNRKGMTQKQFGEKLGFLGKTSDVRITQYESEVRVPKADLVKEMADLLDVDPRALTVPDIDTQLGLMHTLFAIEDMYGLKIDELDGEMVLRLDRFTPEFPELYDKFRSWLQEAKKLKGGEISKDQYDDWRYKYPELDTHQFSVDVLPKEISDALIKEEKKKSKSNKKK